MFKTKLHKIATDDELRPELSRIYFRNDYAYATNGHIGIKQHLSLHDVEDWKELNEKAIHRTIFEQIYRLRRKCTESIATEDGILMRIEGSEILFEYSDVEDKDFRMISYLNNHITKSEHRELVPSIGVNAKYLATIQDVLATNSRSVELIFHGQNRAILVKPNDGESVEDSIEVGVLMPVMLTRY